MRGGRCAGPPNGSDARRQRSSGGWTGIGRARPFPTGPPAPITAPPACPSASSGASSPCVSLATGACIAYHLHLARSTVGRVLNRYHMPLLAHVDRATGLAVRKPRPVRYERPRPGDLVHVDIKKLGRIPDGGGWRVHGRGSAQDRAAGAARDRAARTGASGARGYRYLHHAVDDYSHLVYSEILDDETKATAAGFWKRAAAFFSEAGISVREVLTDNGSYYRSHVFNRALTDAVKHRYTRPYRPQTNGKVERFNRTLLAEWAYARPYTSETEREAAYTHWLHTYNHHRPHTGIKGQTPAQRVHNLTGKYN